VSEACRTGQCWRWLGWLLLPVALCGHAYEPKNHQVITFVAAKQFNNCLQEPGNGIPRLTPLEVRYVVKSNVGQAKANPFGRMFRWNYYDVAGADRRWLWVMDTRFNGHFDDIAKELAETADPGEQLKLVGRLVSYIQDVTSPAHAVPVYSTRFWRFSFGDRFDGYDVDQDELAEAVAEDCPDLATSVDAYQQILKDTALDTLAALQEPLPGLPLTWEAFWSLPQESGSFGEYGPAGNNFGRAVEFDCGEGQRCVLLRHDPLYRQFALARHAAAVRGTMRAMLLWHQQEHPEVLEALTPGGAEAQRIDLGAQSRVPVPVP
jgi:hypothetical protein